MKTLSKEAEAKILQASAAAAGHVNDGLSPNDAITKAASDAQLPPGHVSLLVHAYNTGRTTRQREVGSSPLEKAADFELADASVVLEQLYPSSVKTAAELRRKQVVSFEYAVPPTGMLERRNRQLEKTAAAATIFPPIEKSARYIPPRVDEDGLVKRAYNQVRENTRAIEEARRLVTASWTKAAALLDEIRDTFKVPGHMPFGDALREAELRYGENGRRVMAKIAELVPALQKEAATKQIYFGDNTVCNLVERLLTELDAHSTLKAAYEKTSAELTAKSEETLRPFVPRPSPSILDGSYKAATNPVAWGMAGGAMKDMMGSLAGSIAPPEEKLLQKSINSLTDPSHEAELRNIRTQAMLQDLLTNDPVISGYDHDAALGAFNEIGEISPRAVDQRLIMQSLMRKRLQQGALDPFEIDQLLGMEGKLKKRDQGVMDDQPSASIL